MDTKKQRLKSSISISPKTNIVFNIILIILAAFAIFPLLFVLSISFSSKEAITKYGYTIFPKEFTLEAYRVIFKSSTTILQAFKMSLIITVVGTILGLIMITTYAYSLSREDFAYKKFFNLVAFIPMLFSGGMVASYIVMTQVLKLKNSIWVLILPLMMNTFYIVVMRTFYQTSVPQALIEAARIDGATEFQTFFKIVLPVSLPGIATIALFLTLGYWNDWFNAMLYLDTGSPLTPLQYLLIKIQKTIESVIIKGDMMGTAAQDALRSLPQDAVKMAIVVVATLPIALAYPFFQRYFVEGLTLGAVKE